MMRILVFGGNGQVGRELGLINTVHEIIRVDLADADLCDKGAAAELIEAVKPGFVINAAAYTNVDSAESDAALAARINAEAVEEMAMAAQSVGAGFFHISTDYVFDGRGSEILTEQAPAAPLNVYGQTKYDGEVAALENHKDAIVLRTSWVYSVYGKNFVKTMLRLSDTRDELSIVHDQVGAPTPAGAIAETAIKIADAYSAGICHPGLYHFQGTPQASWADFAEAIFEEAGKSVKVIKITTSEYPTPATRPLFTVLDCSKLKNAYGIDQPNWRKGIGKIVFQIYESANKD